MGCPVQHASGRDDGCPRRSRIPDLEQAGWPRPRAPYRNRWGSPDDKHNEPAKRLPVPWINAPYVRQHDDWLSFRGDSIRAHTERLCAVCGEALGERIMLGAFGARDSRETSGPGAHPRCLWMTVNVCPHFTRRDTADNQIVAYLYEGDELGYINPWDPADPDETDQHADWSTDPYIDMNPVHPAAVPVTRAQLKAHAKRDPLGTAQK